MRILGAERGSRNLRDRSLRYHFLEDTYNPAESFITKTSASSITTSGILQLQIQTYHHSIVVRHDDPSDKNLHQRATKQETMSNYQSRTILLVSLMHLSSVFSTVLMPAEDEPWPPTSGGARIPDPAILDVIDLIARRAHLAKIVAANKFVEETQTVYDAGRELLVLTGVETAAGLHGISPGPLMLFVQAQMDYAKFVEVEWITGWTEKSSSVGEGEFPSPTSEPERAAEMALEMVDNAEVQEEVNLLLAEGGGFGLGEVRTQIVEIGEEQYGALVRCREAVVGMVREGGREAFVTMVEELLLEQLKFRKGIPEEEGAIADRTGVYRRMIAAALGGLFQDSAVANGRPEKRQRTE